MSALPNSSPTFMPSISLELKFSAYTSRPYKQPCTMLISSQGIRDMAIDDSFKKPGAVPFKWEVRPGVPKIQQQPQLPPPPPPPQPKQQLKKQPLPPLSAPSSPFISQRSFPTPQRLKPPPPGSYYLFSPEPRTHSFRSVPRSRSERWRFDQPARVHPECVSPGCFPSTLIKRKESKRRMQKPKADYSSDLETMSRWSVSSRRSVSPLSPASSFSSYRPSPGRLSDAEWAGFGLF